jgi:hypothetical protein
MNIAKEYFKPAGTRDLNKLVTAGDLINIFEIMGAGSVSPIGIINTLVPGERLKNIQSDRMLLLNKPNYDIFVVAAIIELQFSNAGGITNLQLVTQSGTIILNCSLAEIGSSGVYLMYPSSLGATTEYIPILVDSSEGNSLYLTANSDATISADFQDASIKLIYVDASLITS